MKLQLSNGIPNQDMFKCDFHIHSTYSFDSILPIQKILKISKRRNLDCIAITDHNLIRGAIEAKKNAGNNLRVICGSEIRTEYGDIIGLFLNEKISSTKFLEVIDEIKDQGGLIVAPHPFKSQIKNHLDLVDVIEISNGRVSANLNKDAFDYALKNHIPGIGGSDAHIGYEIGTIQTWYPNAIDSDEDLKKEIMRNNPYITGLSSPRWVHYISAPIGAMKTGTMGNLIQSSLKKISRQIFR
jgi:predicted metal-dependent phosphoesterase TrpH